MNNYWREWEVDPPHPSRKKILVRGSNQSETIATYVVAEWRFLYGNGAVIKGGDYEWCEIPGYEAYSPFAAIGKFIDEVTPLHSKARERRMRFAELIVEEAVRQAKEK